MRAKQIGILGFLFFLLSFLVGLSGIYYKSPRLVLEKDISLAYGSSELLTLASPVSAKIYYKISCKPSLSTILSFLDKNGSLISSVNLSKEGAADYILLAREPANVMLKLNEGNSTTCHLKLYYSRFSETLLFLIVIVQFVTCILAISLILSCYIKLRSVG
jgi:hypothetical protein